MHLILLVYITSLNLKASVDPFLGEGFLQGTFKKKNHDSALLKFACEVIMENT